MVTGAAIAVDAVAGGLVVEAAVVVAVVDAAAIGVDAAAVAAEGTSHGFSRIHTDRGCAAGAALFCCLIGDPVLLLDYFGRPSGTL